MRPNPASNRKDAKIGVFFSKKLTAQNTSRRAADGNYATGEKLLAKMPASAFYRFEAKLKMLQERLPSVATVYDAHKCPAEHVREMESKHSKVVKFDHFTLQRFSNVLFLIYNKQSSG